jgi:glycosyltransferase involved in cell wall biosynthesis
MTALDVTRETVRKDVTQRHSESTIDPRSIPVDVEVIVPVYNEAALLADKITELRRYLDESFPFDALVTVIDNASTDETFAIASGLAATLPGVAAVHLPQKGRGRALRMGWSTSVARVVAYMDVDLSSSLSAFLPLVAPLLSGHRDVATGTRLARGSNVVRGTKRELISRSYNLILRVALHGKFSDAQCGFKAVRTDVVRDLLQIVEDEEWFFDTELLIAAQRLGLRMSEVPVDWVDDPDSRVDIVSTAMNDLRGVWRISHGAGRHPHAATAPRDGLIGQVTTDQLIRFAGVGIISTLAYAFLFIAIQQVVGMFVANALALLVCTACNTLVHAELAHDGSGQAQRGRMVGAAFVLFFLSLALTTVTLGLVHLIVGPNLTIELLAVTAVSAVASVMRFAVLRTWIFRTSGTVRPSQRPRIRRVQSAAP